MFERFTERARVVVHLAQIGARELGQRHIGTEHLLVGMLEEREGVAAAALTRAGLSAEGVRAEILRGAQRPTAPQAQDGIPFTPRARKVLELAMSESLRLGNDVVGTEHLLLGLTNLRDGQAIEILATLATGPDAVRHAVRELVDERIGQPAVHRDREPVDIGSRVEDWVRIAPSEDVRRLLNIASGRASDGGRDELDVTDILLAFTLTPGPAVAAGIRLTFDEGRAAIERDRAWASQTAVDRRARVVSSEAARRLLMAAAAGALIRGSCVIEVTDLLLALIADESVTGLFEQIALDRYRTRNSLEREHVLTRRDVA